MQSNVYKIVLLSVFLLLLAIAIYVYRPVSGNNSRITVIGDSQTKIAPDTAVITFSVLTQSSQALTAQQDNARKSEKVKTAVEAVTQNIKTEIKTSSYNLNPQQDYYSGKLPKILGYEVKNTVTVSINDLNQVGAVIDAATTAGANSVEGISFIVGEDSPAQGDALAVATRQAMAKAEAIAKSLNSRIVRVIETHEGGAPDLSSSYAENEFRGSANTAAKPVNPTPIQAGALTVRAQVTVVVEIAVL